MSDLIIRIHSTPNGLEAKLIERGGYTEVVVDAVAGETQYVMGIVDDWIDITENLTTKANI